MIYNYHTNKLLFFFKELFQAFKSVSLYPQKNNNL